VAEKIEEVGTYCASRSPLTLRSSRKASRLSELGVPIRRKGGVKRMYGNDMER
jgi:hypothetical protein